MFAVPGHLADERSDGDDDQDEETAVVSLWSKALDGKEVKRRGNALTGIVAVRVGDEM